LGEEPEINKAKIVALLVGDHLYGRNDVAIRELVQNSIDSCRLSTIEGGNTACKIVLRKHDDGRMVIEDNGLGMDYYEAKEFLSTIGSSFYNSDLFRERANASTYSPIAQYGIGILSCFLIAKGISIETLKEGHDACKFSIESVTEEWKYESGTLKTPGTQITLQLDEDAKDIRLEDSLQRYFLCPEVPIEYSGIDGETKTLDATWAADVICDRYMQNEWDDDVHFKELLTLSMPDYDVIVGRCRGRGTSDTLSLFNRGIYVGMFSISGLDFSSSICVNLKTDLVDLHISRENVKMNAKWRDFVYSLSNDIFCALNERFSSDEDATVISIVSSLVSSRTWFNADSEADFLEQCPFIRSFLEHAPLLAVSNGATVRVGCESALHGEQLYIYNCCSSSLLTELSIISKLCDETPLIINPYTLPSVTKGKKDGYCGLLEFILTERNIEYTELDLRTVLLGHAVEVDGGCPDLLPENVRLATFDHGLRPLVVLRKAPVIEEEDYAMGSAYWGNILLWKQLMEEERMESLLHAITVGLDNRFERVNVKEEPGVYVDASDTFIATVLDKRRQGEFDATLVAKIRRYFKYLSYLPQLVHGLEGCLIAVEVIDNIEAEIANCLGVSRPAALFERMKPDSKLFLEYFRRFGLNFARG